MLVILLDYKLNQTVVEITTMKHRRLVAIFLFDVGVLVVSYCDQAACVQYGHRVVLTPLALVKLAFELRPESLKLGVDGCLLKPSAVENCGRNGHDSYSCTDLILHS